MIEYITGNILDSEAEALVNPVNCVGVMGKGLALQFKKKFPGNFKYYKKCCEDVLRLEPGDILVFEECEKLIINFPTKIHWKDPSKMEYIQKGLETLDRVIEDYRIKCIAIPPLGCGLGGLCWEDVKKEVEKTFEEEEIRVLLYEQK